MKFSPEQLFDVHEALVVGLSLPNDGTLELNAAERAATSTAFREELHRKLAENNQLNDATKQIVEAELKAAWPPLDPEKIRQQQRATTEYLRLAREEFIGLDAKSRARRVPGLKMAINDWLSQARYFSAAQRGSVNDALRERKLCSLGVLTATLKKKHERILKRDRIRGEEELYIVQEILADMEFDISDDDRMKLERMVRDY